jgi:EAL and modified HD-GYP domain-containing signal transduction protein
MFVHIARQPIFNIRKQLFAYELLFRQTLGLHLGELSGDRATTSLLSSTFLTEGIEKITGNKPCFINFTKNLLVKEVASSFPKNKIIVEILEDVLPTTEVLDACHNLSQLGYLIALDDFVYRDELLPLLELADIIKLDYRLSTTDDIERILYRLSRFNLKYLAEKVETYKEFEHARKMGFHYFQGYFFAKPESIRVKEVASIKTNQLRLLAEISKRSTTVSNLEKIIAADVAITYKLLRYINSSYFFLLQKIDSIRQAIIHLGEREIRRFVTLVLISELAMDKPKELVRLSVIRAKFCQLLAQDSNYQGDSEDLFLLGLFSLIDAILDTSMIQVMNKLPLSKEVQQALINQEGPFAPFLQSVVAYEQGKPDECLQSLQYLEVDPTEVYDMYLKSISFSSIID